VTEPLGTILVALVVSLVSPAVLVLLTNRGKRQDRVLDWARQDAVAEQAAKAAALLLAANERVASQTAVADAATQGQLAQIHTLVNSNLTAAMDAELAATVAQLVLLRREASLDIDEIAATDNVAARVVELRSVLDERHKATDEAAAQREGVEFARSIPPTEQATL
jgi:hypothetical protein